MGFRRPITTATDVDTTSGQAGVPGVLISGARATFADGTGGSGYLEATSPGGGTIIGSAFSMVGDGGGGTDPAVALGPDPLPGGGYQGRVHLIGGRVSQDVASDPVVAATALPLNATYLVPFAAGYRAPTYWKLASGLVVLTGLAKVQSVSFAAGQPLAGPLPVGCRPLATLRFGVEGWGSAGWILEVTSGGVINYSAATSGATVAVGQHLSFAGVSFAAEQ